MEVAEAPAKRFKGLLDKYLQENKIEPENEDANQDDPEKEKAEKAQADKERREKEKADKEAAKVRRPKHIHRHVPSTPALPLAQDFQKSSNPKHISISMYF